MFRFTIRDALLVMVIVALGLGWWIDHMEKTAEREEHTALKEKYDALISFVGHKYEHLKLMNDGSWWVIPKDQPAIPVAPDDVP